MPKRTDISTILIIGAGPIVIGQACEFDYSGTQACKALKAEGYRIVLVNSNPATIMTDPDLAHATYIEPITPEVVEKIIEKERTERPDDKLVLLPTMGGQTALNTALTLNKRGVLKKWDVEMIGARAEAIDKAEDRDLFRTAMKKIGLEVPRSAFVNTSDLKQRFEKEYAEGLAAAQQQGPHAAETFKTRWAATEFERREEHRLTAQLQALEAYKLTGLPAIIRPSFTMGGQGGGIAYTLEELYDIVHSGVEASPTSEVLVEESVLGWKEYEMEVVRDRDDNCIIVCSIENLDPMGVHTGDSITVAPALTLTDKEYQVMRNASIAVLREIGVETGGSNVQFAVNPKDGRLIVIEMNPRVSRSSALASKATGFPIAKVAARLAVGYTLDELDNDITGGATPASFEPSIDYVVTKIPRFAFEKFPGAEPNLTTAMKSVGEVMAIGRTFQESLQKALRGLETGLTGLDEIELEGYGKEEDKNVFRRAMSRPTPDRLLKVAQCMRLGATPAQVHESAKYDPWFIDQLAGIIDMEARVREHGLPSDAANFRMLKAMGFSDARLATLAGTTEDKVRKARRKLKVMPVLQAHRHLRCRVCLAHRLHVLNLRSWHARQRRQRGPPLGPREGGDPWRWSQPYRPGHRVRLLLLPRRLRAGRRRLRVDHGQLQPGDSVHRLRHLGSALLRTPHRRRRSGNSPHGKEERHAQGRHRSVRRADPAETRRGAGEGRHSDPRHIA